MGPPALASLTARVITRSVISCHPSRCERAHGSLASHLSHSQQSIERLLLPSMRSALYTNSNRLYQIINRVLNLRHSIDESLGIHIHKVRRPSVCLNSRTLFC